VAAVGALVVAGLLTRGGSALVVGAAVVAVLSALAVWEQRALNEGG
jgi:uncharacterized membrane protein YphA (DoxX/SURF4 family)